MKRPPRIARFILGLTNKERIRLAVLGDFEELFFEQIATRSKRAAQIWYWQQTLRSIPKFLKFSFYWSMTMLKNYLKVAFRNLLKNKFYSLINIGGLAVGMSVFLFISIYTRHELSYNKFHTNHQSIYEVQIGNTLSTAAPLATRIKSQLPEVQSIVRIDDSYGGNGAPILITEKNGVHDQHKVKDILCVDHEFLKLLSFKTLYGDPSTALVQPFSLVLTRSLAQQLFGEDNALGQHVQYIGDRSSTPEMEMTVTAVVEDVPTHSTIQFNGLISFATLYTFQPNRRPVDDDWYNWGYKTLVQIDPQNEQQFTKKLQDQWEEASLLHWPEETPPSIGLVPLTEIRFFNNNRRQFIYLMQIIGVFILAIALINFINLTLASATSRAREVGIRKAIGSSKSALIHQFLCESFIMSLIVTPLSFIIIELSKPLFYSIIQQKIAFSWIHQPGLILLYTAGIFMVCILAGLYPALVMSSFKASQILKGKLNKGKRRNMLRFVLVVTQFVISTTLIFCTFVISSQIHFLQSKPLGFDQHNIIHFKQSKQISQNYDVFRNRLLQNPNIVSMTRSNIPLGRELNISYSMKINGERKSYRATTVDPDFIPTLGIDMAEGRAFSWDIPSDQYGAIIVNETLVKEFQLDEPIGKQIEFIDSNPVIIGIMRDFHTESFHEPVKPAALWYANWNSTISIRLSGQDLAGTIETIQQEWNELSPGYPFEYRFLDKTYGELYRSEQVLQRIITSFATMAILIACLGLLGLISYSARQRTKEMGIRKVLGASMHGLVGLVIREYLLWVLIANAISLPAAAWMMLKWLNNFAYRTPLTAMPFLLAGISALGIALLSVSWQAVRTAASSPVKALKYE